MSVIRLPCNAILRYRSHASVIRVVVSAADSFDFAATVGNDVINVVIGAINSVTDSGKSPLPSASNVQ